MRILVDALTFDNRDGGFSTALKGLARTVTKIPEFEFVIACHDRSRAIFESLGSETYGVSFPIRLKWYLAPFIIERIAQRTGAAAIHHEISAPSVSRRYPFSVTVHDLHFLKRDHVPRLGLGGFAMERYWRNYFVEALQGASRIKAISETTKDDVINHCPDVNPSKVECIYPFIEPLYSPPTTRVYPSQGILRILFLGSIVPRKNLGFLLNALKGVQRPWHLDIAGNVWWGAEELSGWGAEKRITVHGYLEAALLTQVATAAHLFVSPAKYEGFGLPCAEAMGAGLPVFASNIAAHREFIPNECLFDLDNTLQLSQMIDGLDHSKYEKLLVGARHIAEQFSQEQHILGHARFFRDAFSMSPGDRA